MTEISRYCTIKKEPVPRYGRGIFASNFVRRRATRLVVATYRDDRPILIDDRRLNVPTPVTVRIAKSR